jgi:hypothetical protein
MELDEQAQHVYPTLDDGALLTLLLVLRSERDRHLALITGVGKAYRETVGTDLPPARTMGEILERIDEHLPRDDDSFGVAEFVRGMMEADGEDADEILSSAERWQAFNEYATVVAVREQWVVGELTRRGLLPPMG